jgi:uncharacterized membrane protein YhaH (DUF805 family)
MATLNPFKLLALCLQPSGRFSRSQFATVHLGSLAALGIAALGIEPAARFAGASEAAAGILANLAVLACLPVVLVTYFGGGARRWHDLGRSGWYVFLGLVPCAGAIAVLYMLLAPGRPEAEVPRESAVALVAVALAVFGVVGLAVLVSIVVQVFDTRTSANETTTIADIRTMISAQEAYRDSNGGLYEGRLECLARPSSAGCAPGLPADTLPFIDAALASNELRNGYRRRFEPGRAEEADPSVSSRTSVGRFAYVAVPDTPGRSGVRSFCGDSSGIVCYRSDGADIPAPGGECPVTSGGCEPLV